MGALATGLFADDTAQDVRDQWIEAFRKTQSVPKASLQVLRAFRSELKDSDDGPIVRLTLAVMQHKYGRLTAGAKRDALKIISEGQGLDRWIEAGAKSLAKRRVVYASIRKLLNSRQPAPRTPKRESRPKGHPFKAGDIVTVPISKTRVGYIKILEADAGADHAFIALIDLTTRPGGHPERWSGLQFRWFRHRHGSGEFKGQVQGDACRSVMFWGARDVSRDQMQAVGRAPVTAADRRMIARYTGGTGQWLAVPDQVKRSFLLKEPDFQLFVRKPGPIRPGQRPA